VAQAAKPASLAPFPNNADRSAQPIIAGAVPANLKPSTAFD
jgi:hypothetical protein